MAGAARRDSLVMRSSQAGSDASRRGDPAPVARADAGRYTSRAPNSRAASFPRAQVTQVSELRLRDAGVEAARRKLQSGESLSQEDGVRLFDAPLMELGRLAHAAARDRHGDRVYFTVNRQLNPTNVCVLACKFCDYAKKPDAPGAYTMTREQILAHVDPGDPAIHVGAGRPH